MKNKPDVVFLFRSGLAMLAVMVFVSGFKPVSLIDPVEAGKEIYTKGSSPSGQEIVALMSGIKVPATVLPCVNCHGPDGKGRPEGGVIPSNINWEVLSKNNGGQFNDRRKHPPYTESHLKRAITMGLDPAGNELLKTMPQYQMSLEDMNALLAYLKQLGREEEKGVSGSVIKTGFLLPPEIMSTAKRNAFQKTIEAFFLEINQKGGIYHRSFDISFSSSLSESKMNSCFALAACFDLENQSNLTEWATGQEIPIIGAISKWPVEESLKNEFVFYLFPGIAKQSAALVKFIGKRKKAGPLNIALIYAASFTEKNLINRIESECLDLGPNYFKKTALPTDSGVLIPLVQQLKTEKINTVFFLGHPSSGNEFLDAAQQVAWHPDFMSPGLHSGINPFEAPKAFNQKIFLAYPTWLSELTDQGIEFYKTLKTKYDLPEDFQNTQMQALGTALIYVEAVRSCGRKLTRKKLIDRLESMYEYKTGLMPPISYSLNNRIGSKKVYITSVDLEASSLKLETIIE